MNQLKTWIALAVAAICLSPFSSSAAGTIVLNSQSSGPTPFIAILNISVSGTAALDHIDFKVYPKPGSLTRPVCARYSAAYIQSRGYTDLTTGQIRLPVFGLYSNYGNTVALVAGFADNTTKRLNVSVQTPVWTDPTAGAVFLNPTVAQARSASTNLSYDFILLKTFAAAITPVIIDTDGQVRWVGTAGIATQSALLFENGIYISDGGAGMIRMEFDGSYRTVANFSGYTDPVYGPMHITYTGHHQFDYGKYGIIIDCNTSEWTECVNIEVDGQGNVLHAWNLATSVTNAMTAGGDGSYVSDLVRPASTDWFHNNAVTYRPSDDTMIFSSRENYVVATDYTTGAIKWIFGDPAKKWYAGPPLPATYQYNSLRQLALTATGSTLAPIGQHGVSIYRDKLLLHDNGTASITNPPNSPAGISRSYSALRKYEINAHPPTTNAGSATEIWTYDAGQTIKSAYCSSVYEDGSESYLGTFSNSNPTIVFGLDPSGAKVFDYRYPTLNFCGTSWNSNPIHLENLRF